MPVTAIDTQYGQKYSDVAFTICRTFSFCCEILSGYKYSCHLSIVSSYFRFKVRFFLIEN